MTDPWICWLYCYTVGFSLVAASLVLVLKTGAASWTLWTDRRLLLVLVVGSIASASIHAGWIILATR